MRQNMIRLSKDGTGQDCHPVLSRLVLRYNTSPVKPGNILGIMKYSTKYAVVFCFAFFLAVFYNPSLFFLFVLAGTNSRGWKIFLPCLGVSWDRIVVRDIRYLLNIFCTENVIICLILCTSKVSPSPPQVILLDQFDEGLMLLRRLMGWDMIDMTYSRMMETTGGTRRWDGKELKSVPHFDELSQAVREHCVSRE